MPLKEGKVCKVCLPVLFTFSGLKDEGTNLADKGSEATVAIPREDGLGIISFVLFV